MTSVFALGWAMLDCARCNNCAHWGTIECIHNRMPGCMYTGWMLDDFAYGIKHEQFCDRYTFDYECRWPFYGARDYVPKLPAPRIRAVRQTTLEGWA